MRSILRKIHIINGTNVEVSDQNKKSQRLI